MSVGTKIDRYGSSGGKYTSPLGTPYEQRALPYIENPNAYHKYEVLIQIDGVTISEIAEAFDQPGGGIQYELPATIKQLIEDGLFEGDKMMKIEELRKKLQQVGIPEYLYNLEETGRKDERFCLQKVNDKWNVYFRERGVKTTDEFFESEDKACQFILKQLLD